MTFQSTTKQISITALGCLVSVSGFFFLWRYMTPPPKPVDPHIIYAFCGWVATGMAISVPGVFGAALKLILTPALALIKAIKNGNGDSPTV